MLRVNVDSDTGQDYSELVREEPVWVLLPPSLPKNFFEKVTPCSNFRAHELKTSICEIYVIASSL